ncbi:hypothetical protein DICPUDRAFT_73981 [Dictyostelium purpureum]|uniref:FNIP repeat-containing protein n=1 Tax=Dictyostelium purpureum TaxID=5786 RepID=F0Z6F5_DICPU|nr:uncharacterized protein DICPUDRAFT_73981 [Dictyostelium purpureum]EGC40432.1 hypothetical protein DICPUDRAFT_73981 [Dictyostelium purpureum]|eukprot:XP_003282979.1 hypothetical protein DICPUDRAFT_73981 [Dictyostelium purpureum]
MNNSNISISNNNTNNMDSNNSNIIDNSILFFKCYRNIVINNKIFYFLSLINSLSANIIINTKNIKIFDKIINNNYNKKNFIDYYLEKVETNKKDIDQENLETLLGYFRSIELIIPSPDDENLSNIIKNLPPNIDSIEIFDLKIIPPNFIFPSSIKNLTIHGNITSNSKTLFSDSSITRLKFSKGLEQIDLFGIPKSLTHLSMGYFFNKKLTKGLLPQTLKTLYLSNCFNKPLTDGDIPDSVTNLYFGENFNQYLIPGHLPPKLSTLHFGLCFNKEIKKDVLPNSITNLQFDLNYKETIDCKYLPTNLKHLKIDISCGGLIGNLPIGLETLYLYDRNIQNFKLPDSLKILKVKSLKHSPDSQHAIYFPESLIKVTLSPSIKIENDSFLKCTQLKKIKGISRIEQIQCILPESVKSIKFNFQCEQALKNSIPDQFKSISFSRNSLFDQPLDFLSNNSKLKKIRINNKFSNNLDSLSKLIQLETLTFSTFCKHTFLNLPPHLTTLSLSQQFRLPLSQNLLPKSLTKLELREYPLKIPKDALPPTLKYLKFSNTKKRVDEPVENSVIPDSVTCLEICSSFSSTQLPKEWLPKNIKTLIIKSYKTNLSNDLSTIDSLETIYIINTNELFKNVQKYDLNLFLKIKALNKIKLQRLFYQL